MLTAALRACKSFDVDILLLPEYSTRPDTVDWLAQQLPSLAPNTSVWAGTYRLPPGMSNPADEREWSAILEVVFPGHVGLRDYRLKKYPAPAADEVFHPGDTPLNPLFKDQKFSDLRSYVHELICSEVFLVSFPSNLLPLARLRRELLRKFGSCVGGKNIMEMVKEDVMPDIMSFAQSTAMSENPAMRRTILLVPAMTSRCEDYSVLGQSALFILWSHHRLLQCSVFHLWPRSELLYRMRWLAE